MSEPNYERIRVVNTNPEFETWRFIVSILTLNQPELGAHDARNVLIMNVEATDGDENEMDVLIKDGSREEVLKRLASVPNLTVQETR